MTDSSYVSINSGNDDHCWSPGASIIIRAVPGGHAGHVRSMTVVDDGPDLLVLYLAPGYPCKRRTGVYGGPRDRNLIVGDGGHEDWTWSRNRVLVLYQHGDAHLVYLFRHDQDDSLLGWYIDLVQPLRRTRLGFDSRDHILDVWFDSDRSAWSWKDEDEFAWCQETGRISGEDALAIRAEGERAIERLTADGASLYREWESWSPDTTWPVPTIPEGWNIVHRD